MHRVGNDLAWGQEAGIDRIKVATGYRKRPAEPKETPSNLPIDFCRPSDQKEIALC
jgi:hypothetical protein